jgi:hypothetical protein
MDLTQELKDSVVALWQQIEFDYADVFDGITLARHCQPLNWTSLVPRGLIFVPRR